MKSHRYFTEYFGVKVFLLQTIYMIEVYIYELSVVETCLFLAKTSHTSFFSGKDNIDMEKGKNRAKVAMKTKC